MGIRGHQTWFLFPSSEPRKFETYISQQSSIRHDRSLSIDLPDMLFLLSVGQVAEGSNVVQILRDRGLIQV